MRRKLAPPDGAFRGEGRLRCLGHDGRARAGLMRFAGTTGPRPRRVRRQIRHKRRPMLDDPSLPSAQMAATVLGVAWMRQVLALVVPSDARVQAAKDEPPALPAGAVPGRDPHAAHARADRSAEAPRLDRRGGTRHGRARPARALARPGGVPRQPLRASLDRAHAMSAARALGHSLIRIAEAEQPDRACEHRETVTAQLTRDAIYRMTQVRRGAAPV